LVAQAALGPWSASRVDAATWAELEPIVAERCAVCHTDGGRVGPAPEGYRLTAYAATLDATDRARVIPGHPQASELLRKVRGQSLPRMPLDGPPWLADDEIALIETWIAQGGRVAADGGIIAERIRSR